MPRKQTNDDVFVDANGCLTQRVAMLADDITRLLADVGLPEPDPIAVMLIDHQMAQKLHACTGPGTNAHMTSLTSSHSTRQRTWTWHRFA